MEAATELPGAHLTSERHQHDAHRQEQQEVIEPPREVERLTERHDQLRDHHPAHDVEHDEVDGRA